MGTDRDNMLRLSASRFSASRFSASRCMQNQRWFGAKQSEAFASMMEEELDTGNARNNKDGIQLDEWMDNMPESLLQKLGDHAKAEAWRRMIEPVEQRQ